jgi:hypothetical protein
MPRSRPIQNSNRANGSWSAIATIRAAQPRGTPQGARPGDTAQGRQQGRDTGRAQTTRREGKSSLTVNDEQRTQIVERLRRERAATNENVNIQVNVGERLPPHVRPRPLPPDIVRIAPQYRDYERGADIRMCHMSLD